jgi:hypothetical protein
LNDACKLVEKIIRDEREREGGRGELDEVKTVKKGGATDRDEESKKNN